MTVCLALGKHNPSILSTLYLPFSMLLPLPPPLCCYKKNSSLSPLHVFTLHLFPQSFNLKRLLVIPIPSPGTLQVVEGLHFFKNRSQ